MELHVAAHTDVGRVRKQNEDSFLTALPVVAVADGMGGHNAGEVASKLALDVIDEWLKRPGAEPGRLKDAVLEANRTIWSKGREDPKLQGMGTTLTAVFVDGDTATLAHVGDSRAYLYRQGELLQLTEDQTLVQKWVREGEIDASEAAHHPNRNILLQALGGDPDVHVAELSVDLEPGDRLMLASDGLHGPVPDELIKEILTTVPDAGDACRRLVDEANAAGGEDNITVVLLDATATASGEAEPDGARQVIVSKPPTGRYRAPWERARRRRLVLASAVGAVVLALAVGAVAIWHTTTSVYLVGASADKVAILQGAPGTETSPTKAKVIRVTDVPLASLPDSYQRTLRQGLVVRSVAEAEKTIANLPRKLGPNEQPTPVPTAPLTAVRP